MAPRAPLDRPSPLDPSALGTHLLDVYDRLLAAYGPQAWWPAETPFEMIVGAILTQSAAWTNVEKAMRNLKEAGALSPAALRSLHRSDLARLIKPSGYFNVKAAKLQAFVEHMAQYSDSLDALFSRETTLLRQELLGIYGIGEETADSILLYAAGRPVFVVDAYTMRIVPRLGILPDRQEAPHRPKLGYREYQEMFHRGLPADPSLFNEYHALLVRLGKERCRTRPLCQTCPLTSICPTGQKQSTPGL